jgi:DNA repair protein RecN (Recombination protein N)
VLDELRVRNLGILEDVRIEPGEGLTVLSGETGAGKTMLLGALRLLTGQRAPSDAIGPHGDSALVEGRLIFEETEMVLTRRIGGRGSHAYLNGEMVPNRVLDERTESLIEIVGQDDRFQLLKPSALRALVDSALDDAAATTRYRKAWAEVRGLEERLALLGGDRGALERERDILRYQLQDIRSAGFEQGDDEVLMGRAARLRSAGELTERLDRARGALDTVLEASGDVIEELRAVARVDPSSLHLVEAADTLGVLTAELARLVREVAESVDHDPGTLEEVELRLGRLAELRRKYGATLEQVLEFAVGVEARLQELVVLLDHADTLGADLDVARAELDTAGRELLEARRAAAALIEADSVKELADLGLGGARLAISVEPSVPGPEGADTVRVAFSSDSRLTAGPLERIASGGELSRVVLALRLASHAGDAPILAFDEIDAGVGGETALVLGRKLARLAAGRQVLCVTHLPQVAAFADRHLVVTRAGTSALVEQVDGEARLRELSRMLAGLPESVQGRLHAQELLAAANIE